MYQQLIKTYISVINTKDLVRRATEKKGLDIDVASVLSNLNVIQAGDNTQILQISYVDTDKNRSKDVVQAITEEFISYSSQLITNSNVKVVEEASLPEEPISPNKKMNILISLVFGLLVGVGLSIILEFMDNTFKDKDTLEEFINLPVIGVIPNWEKLK